MLLKGPLVLVQARMSSTRFPGKSLAKVCGIPLAILACKRAQSDSNKVVLLTSNEESDDILASHAKQNNVEVFRGDLQNVLERFVKAIEGYSDHQIVIRLTADNFLPNGAFLKDLVTSFVAGEHRYMTTSDRQAACLSVPAPRFSMPLT